MLMLSLYCATGHIFGAISTQRCHAYIDESPKAIHYKCFKSLFTPEFYLNTDRSYLLKHTLSNFRCSSHDLMIDRGRQLPVDSGHRYCQLCIQHNPYPTEDEYHFFFECNSYK